MKKAYSKPEAKKISFQYTKVVAASGQYCDQGWTKATVLIPWDASGLTMRTFSMIVLE